MESQLLLGTPPQTNDASTKSASLAELVLKGEYSQVLKSKIAEDVLRKPDIDASTLEAGDLKGFFAPRVASAVSSGSSLLDILCLGIAFLDLFVQENWTGPAPHKFKPEDVAQLFANGDEFASALPLKRALEHLSSDNEDAYALTRAPLLLLLSLGILEALDEHVAGNVKDKLPSLAWWQARGMTVQQKTLENPSATLYESIMESMEKAEASLDVLPAEPDLKVFFYLEFGLIHHYHKQDQKAKTMFDKAQELSGLRWQLSGAIGKRTRFQQDSTAQLVVVAESTGTVAKEPAKANGKSIPEALPLNDELLLEKVDFSADGASAAANQKSLKIVDQCILLAFCLNVRNTNPIHGLTQEEMLAYVQRILDDENKDFAVYTMALLLRSRLEATKSRTVERSILQLQTLVDQVYTLASSRTKEDGSTARERLARFWFVDAPSVWQLERELGERWMSIGMVVSALEIFERLQLWEDAIECYRSMEKLKKAEELLRERLEITPKSPKLWCLLGDVKGDPVHWEHAWNLSEAAGRRYARAMRSLGSYWFKKQEFKKSMECYSKALSINPLYENSWFILGCAALQLEDYDTASMAFSRVVSLNHENAEAWANLASVHIRQSKRADAFFALRQALKEDYENWKIWQNYLYVATDLAEISEAIKATERLVDLRWQKEKADSVDLEVLRIITDQVIKKLTQQKDDSTTTFLVNKLSALFEFVVEKIASSPGIWTEYARFERARGNKRKAIDCYQKSYRTIAALGDAEGSEDGFKALAEATLDYVDALKELGPQKVGDEVAVKDWQYQARMTLRTVVGRTKKNWEGTETFDKLEKALEGVKSSS